ncbi:DUF2182 domain-containing protein [Roseibium algae]|uniref:DUF2182 domain-containing protein n=1 Tax=Roseibium algae TaxID=3123038 RepID=A0ABU8TP31_9HYPH
MRLIPSGQIRRSSDFNSDQPRGWPYVLVCLLVLTAGGWTYLSAMIVDMIVIMDMSQAGPGMGLFNRFNIFHDLPANARAALAAICLPSATTSFGMPAETWGWQDAAKVFVMWLMMALAMMLPSAIPMLKNYMLHQASQNLNGTGRLSVLMAFQGYLSIWLGYAVVATVAQWGLVNASLLSPMMAPISMAFSASVLLAAGIYQFTPAKHACLLRCWYPRFVFSSKADLMSAYREGLLQGFACLGCCFAVMSVMFSVGLMNVIWIAILGIVMSVEKTFPSIWFYKIIGIIFIAWGSVIAILSQGGIPV